MSDRVLWLRALIREFRRQYTPGRDDDPLSTQEMLRECECLAAELEAGLPGDERPVVVGPGDDPRIPF
ncbi:MAG: hypothetical protein JWO38_8272 [Gemmataceae bacterium]|nr:hypothetical protein [Gemmataceae bacterium]